MNDDLDNLRTRIQDLETQLIAIKGRLEDATGPLQRVFVAAVEADGTWQEKTRVGADWEDFARLCDDDTHASKALDLDTGQWCLLEVDDNGDRRYIKISGGSGEDQQIYVKIVDTFAGRGAYEALEWFPDSADLDGSDDVTEALLGETNGTSRAVVLYNLAETVAGAPAGSHILDVPIGSPIYLVRIAHTNADGSLVCYINQPVPNGTDAGQVWQMQTATQPAWGHPTIPNT